MRLCTYVAILSILPLAACSTGPESDTIHAPKPPQVEYWDGEVLYLE